MSQREKAGSSTARLAVGAGEDVEGVPEAVRCRAWFASCSPFAPPPRSDHGFAFGCLWSRWVGVAQPAKFAATPSVRPAPFPLPCFAFSRSNRAACFAGSAPTFIAAASGVGHPEQPLSDVRRAKARSAQIGGPAGISRVLQISAYSGEPFTSKFARNLLSKDDCRPALGDEAVKSGPEVSFVGMAAPGASARKRLTGTASGPGGSVVRPAGEPEGMTPSADAGEEVALVVAVEVGRVDVFDAALIDVPGRDQPSDDQVAQPLRREGLDLVVVGGHSRRPPGASRADCRALDEPGTDLLLTGPDRLRAINLWKRAAFAPILQRDRFSLRPQHGEPQPLASISKRTWTNQDGSKGVAYVVWYRERGGKRKAKQFPKRRDAKDFAEQISEHRRRYERSRVPPKLTVGKAADDWLKACEKGRGERGPLESASIRAYESQIEMHIKPRIGDHLVAGFERSDSEKFRQQLLDSLSRPMARKVFYTASAIFSHALGEADNPFKGLTVKLDRRSKQGPDIPEPSEIRACLLKVTELAEDPKKPERNRRAWQRYRAILYTLVFTGIRAGELRGLPRQNVDLTAGTIRIDQRADETGKIGPPKTPSSRRTIEVPDILIGILRVWLLMAPPSKAGLVFPNWEGNVETTANLHMRFWRPLQIACRLYTEEPVLDSAGKPTLDEEGRPEVKRIPKYNLHALRHYHASDQIRNGATALDVKNRLGHASIQITFDTYGHLFEDDAPQRRARQNRMAERLLG